MRLFLVCFVCYLVAIWNESLGASKTIDVSAEVVEPVTSINLQIKARPNEKITVRTIQGKDKSKEVILVTIVHK